MSTSPVTQHSNRDHSPGVHVTATILTLDDTLSADDGFAGLAIKQIMPGAYANRDDLAKIAIGEKYYLWDCGEADVELDTAVLGFTPVKGTRLWIDPVTNVVTNATAAGRLKLGIVRNVPPERGLTSAGTKGFYTISFDARKDM